MGYTHYWTANKVDPKAYKAALKDIRAIIKADDKKMLAGGSGKGRPARKGAICFNGQASKDEDYETFFLPHSAEQLEKFNFCKTGERPYDLFVVACLARLAQVPGIEVSSDGDYLELELGVAFASAVLKRTIPNPKTLDIVKRALSCRERSLDAHAQ